MHSAKCIHTGQKTVTAATLEALHGLARHAKKLNCMPSCLLDMDINVGAAAWQDWLDIDFAIREGVDFIAVSFVKSADVIKNLKSYLNARADKVSLRRCTLSYVGTSTAILMPLPAWQDAYSAAPQLPLGPSRRSNLHRRSLLLWPRRHNNT